MASVFEKFAGIGGTKYAAPALNINVTPGYAKAISAGALLGGGGSYALGDHDNPSYVMPAVSAVLGGSLGASFKHRKNLEHLSKYQKQIKKLEEGHSSARMGNDAVLKPLQEALLARMDDLHQSGVTPTAEALGSVYPKILQNNADWGAQQMKHVGAQHELINGLKKNLNNLF